MENKNIALIVILILLVVFIAVISLRLYTFLRELNKEQPLKALKDSFNQLSIYVFQQMIPLQNSDYNQMILTTDQIQYSNKNKEKLICKFKTDQQYFYNQLITQQALNQGDMSVLDAFVMHLNSENFRHFLQQTDFQKIEILFLPSSILDESQMQSKSIQERIKDFLFYFKPIDYQIDVLYQRIFFIKMNQNNQNIIFIELDFERKIFILHSTSCEEKEGSYIELCEDLNFILHSIQPYTSLCRNCKPKKEQLEKKFDYYAACFLAYKYNTVTKQSNIENVEDLKNYIKQKLIQI